MEYSTREMAEKQNAIQVRIAAALERIATQLEELNDGSPDKKGELTWP